MKIAIDLNYVLRDIHKSFIKNYNKCYDTEFNHTSKRINSIDVLENNDILKFKTTLEKKKFLYEDYPYEIFGCAGNMYVGLIGDFNDWMNKVVPYFKENVDIILVTTGEGDLASEASHFFISKGYRVRRTFFPIDYKEVWDECDVLVTANKKLLKSKPSNKLSVRIDTGFNLSCNADLSYNSVKEILNEEFLNTIYNVYKNNNNNKSWLKKIKTLLKK